MRINITGRHIKITADLRKYAEERAEKLSRYFDQIQHVEVVLICDGEQRTAEMIVGGTRGSTLVGRATAKDIRAAIDAAVDKLEIQITRMKEKLLNHRARSNESIKTPEAKKSGPRRSGPPKKSGEQFEGQDEEE